MIQMWKDILYKSGPVPLFTLWNGKYLRNRYKHSTAKLSTWNALSKRKLLSIIMKQASWPKDQQKADFQLQKYMYSLQKWARWVSLFRRWNGNNLGNRNTLNTTV